MKNEDSRKMDAPIDHEHIVPAKEKASSVEADPFHDPDFTIVTFIWLCMRALLQLPKFIWNSLVRLAKRR